MDRVKTAYTVKFDEACIAQLKISPNVHRLRDALDGIDMPTEADEITESSYIDLLSYGCPFTSLKMVFLKVKCVHAIFFILLRDCSDRRRAFIADMHPHSTGASLLGWKYNYAGAYIFNIN
jgi:hypothetical protein